jgi:hypothetical protein
MPKAKYQNVVAYAGGIDDAYACFAPNASIYAAKSADAFSSISKCVTYELCNTPDNFFAPPNMASQSILQT